MPELPDDCFPRCRAPRVRYVCPKNGEPYMCEAGDTDEHIATHVREEYGIAGRRPMCETHRLQMVQAR